MSDIIGFVACSQALKSLLDEIAGNIKTGGAQGPDSLQASVMTETRKLVDFTNRTEPADVFDAQEVANVQKIDRTADAARRDIFGDAADAIVGRMHDRISELNQLEKSVRHEAAENERAAEKLRLVPLKNTIDALTETVVAFKEARDVLSDQNAEEAAVISKIDSVIRSITALDKSAKDLFPAT